MFYRPYFPALPCEICLSRLQFCTSNMYGLAIDTSCDETSAAVLKNDAVLSNIISSQVNLHQKWGGVVPDIARRAHTENIEQVILEALAQAHVSLSDIDVFSATYGPGLAIALEIGLKKAQELSQEQHKPFVPVNHMEGHLLSSFAKNSIGRNPKAPTSRDFPAIGLLVSGGHTELIYMKEFGDYTIIGETLDDAAGEAFDKVAKMLDLGYPGGPIISEFAKKGNKGRFTLPIPMERSDDFNFSYSGLKTACLYKLETIRPKYKSQRTWVYDFCADFVESVIASLVIKLSSAVSHYHVKSVLLGGGVISNNSLRQRIRATMRKRGISVFIPYSSLLYTDNAGMIGIAAFYALTKNKAAYSPDKETWKIDRDPIARLGEYPIIN